MTGAKPPADGSGVSDERSQGLQPQDGPGPGWPLTAAAPDTASPGHEVTYAKH